MNKVYTIIATFALLIAFNTTAPMDNKQLTDLYYPGRMAFRGFIAPNKTTIISESDQDNLIALSYGPKNRPALLPAHARTLQTLTNESEKHAYDVIRGMGVVARKNYINTHIKINIAPKHNPTCNQNSFNAIAVQPLNPEEIKIAHKLCPPTTIPANPVLSQSDNTQTETADPFWKDLAVTL